jgi:thiol-disulfide isomerase/thioredoxin
MRYISFFALLLATLSCSQAPKEFKTGTWRGIIHMQDQELPFNFDVEKVGAGYKAWIRNSNEKILLDEITVEGDSVEMTLDIFDASLKARIDGDRLTGTYIKYYNRSADVPFSATWGESHRFVTSGEDAGADFNGKYQVEFKDEKDAYPSVAMFQQDGNDITGTFLTTTGDYRYLEGNVVDGQLMLSGFDGNHAYLFFATKKGDSIAGDFYSGKTSHEKFSGVKNDEATIPDPESLSYLKPGYETLEFSFPDLTGKKVSLTDEKFRNKVVVLQILGSWCPNCLDETKFLTEWYVANKDRGVEILGLAYERKADFAYASDRVKKMITKMNIPYDIVIAGVNDKEKASETLPALNAILAFPTTIIIGKDGKVKNIHTGFEGPGTGVYYERYKERFNQLINELLTENIKLPN